MQKVCFSLAGATKYAIWPKMSLGRSGIDFVLILAAFGVPGGAQNEAKSAPGGGRKNHRFSRPLFFRFWLILGAQGGPKVFISWLFFASFSVLGANFFDRASFSAILMDFDGLGKYF